MSSVYDWATVTMFAGLIVLFLKRSESEDPRDSLWQYLVAAVGCAIINYLGNEGHHVPAVMLAIATLGYVLLVLKPFKLPGID